MIDCLQYCIPARTEWAAARRGRSSAASPPPPGSDCVRTPLAASIGLRSRARNPDRSRRPANRTPALCIGGNPFDFSRAISAERYVTRRAVIFDYFIELEKYKYQFKNARQKQKTYTKQLSLKWLCLQFNVRKCHSKTYVSSSIEWEW